MVWLRLNPKEGHPLHKVGPSMSTNLGTQPKMKTPPPSLILCLYTHFLSVSVSLSLDDCINTGKAHSTDAYTLTVQHQFTVTPLKLSLTHSHTSTVLCGQAGG